MMLTPADSLPAHASESHWVSLRYFCVTRLVVAGMLLLATAVVHAPMLLGEFAPVLFLRVLLAYILVGSVFLLLAVFWPTRFDLQLWIQLTFDVVAITLLLYASGGARTGMSVLFLLPVAGAAILGPALAALFFAAISSLAILGEAVWRELTFSVDSVNFLQAGLYGASLFAIAWVMNRLAARLISQEHIARLRGQALQSQIEVNRAVVAEMQDGVLVLSSAGEPRALNPAAARMLQINEPDFNSAVNWLQIPAVAEIRRRFLERQGEPVPLSEVFEVTAAVQAVGGGEFERRFRVRFAPSSGDASGRDQVVFLEDLALVEERAQQLKLASMGRLTASIAHEIRNPLAAISHASALLAEEELEPGSARLLRIVHNNIVRLNRIVENVLQVSRRGAATPESIDLSEYLTELVAEFCHEQGVQAEVVSVWVSDRLAIFFNREHLRAVLFNLLQNACRHASGNPGCIGVAAKLVLGDEGEAGHGISGPRVEIVVEDDGPPIDAEIRQHLFEPFFTTHARGTGLGLYLARELCLANRAVVNYFPRADETRKGSFLIIAPGALL